MNNDQFTNMCWTIVACVAIISMASCSAAVFETKTVNVYEHGVQKTEITR